ncbi:MAG: ABC transporter substrate-binding protein [Minisyncoccia bacterium]
MENENRRIRQLKWTGKFPKKDEINKAIALFSQKEKMFFGLLVIVLIFSTLGILQMVNRSQMTQIPLHGGTISEGVVGTPRFINPVLASSPADRDMVSLVYSGLMRKGADRNLIPDLAEKYSVSKDGLVYTFTLKENMYFQDEEPVTADDIIFTIKQVKDSVIKSPFTANWEGVMAQKIDDRVVQFTLRQASPLFLENATLGIMPEHLWNNSPIELNDANTNPVGSGPYLIKNMARESSGIINSYELESFKNFALGEPFIREINMRFYPNEDALITALENQEVDQVSSITPDNANALKEKNYEVDSSVLPRVFGLFFNQNKNQLFLDKTVTNAIDKIVDKDRIVREVLHGYGIAIDDPIPPNMIAYQKLGAENVSPRSEVIKKVEESLAKAGWVKGEDGFLSKTTTTKGKKTVVPLQFSISTGNAPELAKTAELIKNDLATVGMKVEVKTFEVGNLNQSVIRPRDYEALLFGQIINHESDLFAFWHSSQRKDPGLNVAMYTNARVDKILEEAVTTVDEQSRIKKYAEFENEIKKDMPAVFLYSPNFTYVVSPNLSGISIDHIISPGDRFSNIYSWYTKTENVWKIFSKYRS